MSSAENSRLTEPFMIKGIITLAIRAKNNDPKTEEQRNVLSPIQREKLFGRIPTRPMSKQTTS